MVLTKNKVVIYCPSCDCESWAYNKWTKLEESILMCGNCEESNSIIKWNQPVHIRKWKEKLKEIK